MNQIEKKYEKLCLKKSDINEHLPKLKEYALLCEHITEMGVRSAISTYAFLAANPKMLISIDIIKHNNVNKIEKFQNKNFKFILGSTLDIDIDETDLLFIDTLHTYSQLSEELKRHANKVKKYIIFHDTTSYEFKDENNKKNSSNKKNSINAGLWPAIAEFLQDNKNWKIKERFNNNNGLTILEKT